MYRWLRLKAGTGKSTLIKYIISTLNLNPQTDVCYIAFTGKAATVLQSKGCPNAKTAHKLLYKSKPMPNGKYIFEPRKVLEESYKLIVVDEISMLPKDMWELLLWHKVPILACGDPAQLPPIDKTADNHVLDHPHIFLDEIMRQEQESEIIRLSMHIREGKPLSSFQAVGSEVMICDRSQLVPGMYNWADQILCATNAKRDNINSTVRRLYGRGYSPEIGDKIISLKNHWDWASESGEWVLTNGSIGTITQFHKQDIVVPNYIHNEMIPFLFTNMQLEDGDKFTEIPIDYNALVKGTPTLTPEQIYKMNHNKRIIDAPFNFAYAYAITVWKAQGSQWPKVLLFEENFPIEKEEHQRYLYTGITRAENKIVIIKK